MWYFSFFLHNGVFVDMDSNRYSVFFDAKFTSFFSHVFLKNKWSYGLVNYCNWKGHHLWLYWKLFRSLKFVLMAIIWKLVKWPVIDAPTLNSTALSPDTETPVREKSPDWGVQFFWKRNFGVTNRGVCKWNLFFDSLIGGVLTPDWEKISSEDFVKPYPKVLCHLYKYVNQENNWKKQKYQTDT